MICAILLFGMGKPKNHAKEGVQVEAHNNDKQGEFKSQRGERRLRKVPVVLPVGVQDFLHGS